MPACVPVFKGNNGGATMPGVTGNQIKIVYVVAQANAEVNAILQSENLAATQEQICEGIQAWVGYLNKRYDFYGRKIVSLDGPASNNNNGSAQQSKCHFPYFQSQCSLTPPDEKCYRAEADTIARMHPAMAFFTGDGAMVYRLAQDHIVTGTGNLAPDSYYKQLAPYMYGLTNGSVQAHLFAEYWCKKLADKPVQYGGAAPGDVHDPDSNPTTPPPSPSSRRAGGWRPGCQTSSMTSTSSRATRRSNGMTSAPPATRHRPRSFASRAGTS